MIKSTFSRNPSKLPPSCSSKKPSLASLAQKLQDVDLSSTSSLPDNGLKKPLMPFSITDDSGSLLIGSGKLTAVDGSNEDHCSNSEKLGVDNVDVDGVFYCTSNTISECGNVDSAMAACFHKPDGNEATVDSRNDNMLKRSGTTLAATSGSQNDCSSELHQLHINPSPQKRCRLAKPTPFGLALSAIPNPSARAVRRSHKVVLYRCFLYSRQTAAVAGIRHRSYSIKSQTIRPFDFSTPSPDDIVRQKQQMAFGASTK